MMIMKRNVGLAWAAVFFALAPGTAVAQTSFGRISGTVTDPSGAAVPGVSVTVRNTDTQAARVLSTDERGFYVAENLPIGPYAVEANPPGFKRSRQSGFFLVADGRITVDVHLQLGDATQSVDVVATQADALNTVSGELSHVIDAKQVDNLSLNGRSYTELLTLVPGAVVTNPDQFGVLTSLSATQQVVNGHRSNQNNLTVDGVGNLDAGANGSLINNVSPDFLQEVKIQTSNFSAEYGRSAGASFNVVTKNGTNEFHGGAYEYFRNDLLDARNFFSPNKTELRFNNFGYDVGGPVRKNKLFFFAGQDWKRLRQQASPVRTTLPTTAQMQGDFSGTSQIIDYPGTTTPFPNNVIPPSMLTPDGQAIMHVYQTAVPLAASFTNRPTANNAIFQSPSPLNYREELVRLDYHTTDRHSLYGRFIQDSNVIYVPNGPGGNIPITPENRLRPGKSFLVSETWVASPTVVNEAHLGASWNSQNYVNLGNTWDRTLQGFAFQRVFNTVGPYPNGIPDVTITNFASFNGPAKTLHSPTTEIEANDTISLTRGGHAIRAGVMIIRNRKDQNGRSPYDGVISFNNVSNPNTTGYALADALLGNFSTYTEASYDPLGKYRYTEPSVFLDDAWKVTRKLSIDLGLRYEYMMAMYSTANNLTDFDPSRYDPAQAVQLTSKGAIISGSGNLYNGLVRVANGIPSDQTYLVPNATSPQVLAVPSGAPRGMYPSRSTWSPRAGFAYALSEKTVVRGGFGMFYDRIQGNPTFYTLANPPYVSSVEFDKGNLSNITGGSVPSVPWGSIQTINPNLKTPYSEQFSFSVQRELPLHLFSQIAYVGTLGHHLLLEPDINQPTFAALSAVPSTTVENTLRPYAGFSQIQQFLSDGNSNYHALQVNVSRRAGRVTFTGGYTWSKNLGDTSSDTANDLDYYNRRVMYGPLNSVSTSGAVTSAGSIDIRHVFVGSFVWDLPELQHESAWLRGPLGGWQLSGILHVQTGGYYTIVAISNILGTRVADYIGGPAVLPNPGPNGWLNPAAFAVAPQSRWGTGGAGSAQGPGMQMYNLSVAKTFVMRERFKLRARVDFVNAFNNVNFQGPSTNLSVNGFGTISTAYPPRDIQLGMKFEF